MRKPTVIAEKETVHYTAITEEKLKYQFCAAVADSRVLDNRNLSKMINALHSNVQTSTRICAWIYIAQMV